MNRTDLDKVVKLQKDFKVLQNKNRNELLSMNEKWVHLSYSCFMTLISDLGWDYNCKDIAENWFEYTTTYKGVLLICVNSIDLRKEK